MSQAEAWLWRSLVSQKALGQQGLEPWVRQRIRPLRERAVCVHLSLTLTSGGALPHPSDFPLSCIVWLFKTLMLGFHYGKCCLCPGRLEKAAKVSLAAGLSTCCPGNRRQGKQDLSDGKCQLQAEWGGGLRGRRESLGVGRES